MVNKYSCIISQFRAQKSTRTESRVTVWAEVVHYTSNIRIPVTYFCCYRTKYGSSIEYYTKPTYRYRCRPCNSKKLINQVCMYNIFSRNGLIALHKYQCQLIELIAYSYRNCFIIKSIFLILMNGFYSLVDCRVNSWSSWTCAAPCCAVLNERRTRNVQVPRSGSGRSCPSIAESRTRYDNNRACYIDGRCYRQLEKSRNGCNVSFM